MAEPHAVDPRLGTRLIRGAAWGRPALEEMLPPLEHLDLTPVADAVSVRSAVVWGSRDVHGPGNGLELAAALRGTPIELEGVGHMPMLEAPYAFRRAIDGFV